MSVSEVVGRSPARSRRLTRVAAGRYSATIGGESYLVERAGLGWRIDLGAGTAMTCRSLVQVRRILASVDSTLAALDHQLSY